MSGNSFISPPPLTVPGPKDSRLTLTHFERKVEEDQLLGLYAQPEPEPNTSKPDETVEEEETNLDDEVHQFHANCPNCGVMCDTKMKVTKIPYFKEVIVMATTCDGCGSRTNEVKSGSGIEPKGRKITFQVMDIEDLSRDVLKVR